MYVEALHILQQALTSRKLTFHGAFYDYADVPMELEPFQKPRPPFWSGAGAPDGGHGARSRSRRLVRRSGRAPERPTAARARGATASTSLPTRSRRRCARSPTPT